MTDGDRARRAWQIVALCGVVIALGLLPWSGFRDHFPHSVDATKWVTQSHVQSRGWVEWIVNTRHFIGYRPLAAASFTVNSLVSGWWPWSYRLVDVAAHGLLGVATWALYRSWTGDRSWWGLLAPAILFLHPATEDVVPHLARRSYSLAGLLGTAALVVWTAGLRREDRWRWLGLGTASVLLAGALLSNEVAFVVVGVLPLVALHEIRGLRPVRWTRALTALLPMAVATAGCLLLRLAVLGHLGGYHKLYFAFARNGRNLVREMRRWAPWDVFEASMRYLAFPSSASGDAALIWTFGTGPAMACGVVLGGWLGWQCVVRPVLRRADPVDRLPALLAVWIVGYALLYALTGSWFWRQAYPMLVPASLLATLLVRRALTRPLGWRIGIDGVPLLLFAVSVAWYAPPLRGVDMEAYRGDFKMNDVLHQAWADLHAHAPPGATVYLVLPLHGELAGSTRLWLRKVQAPFDLRLLAVVRQGKRIPTLSRMVTLERAGSRRRLVIDRRMDWSAATASDFFGATQGRRLWLDRLGTGGEGRAYLYAAEADGTLLLEVGPAASDQPIPFVDPEGAKGRKKGRKGRKRG